MPKNKKKKFVKKLKKIHKKKWQTLMIFLKYRKTKNFFKN